MIAGAKRCKQRENDNIYPLETIRVVSDAFRGRTGIQKTVFYSLDERCGRLIQSEIISRDKKCICVSSSQRLNCRSGLFNFCVFIDLFLGE